MTPSFTDLGGWPSILRQLLASEHLSAEQARVALAEVLGGSATAAQLAAFIVALRMKGETVEEITGLVQAMLDVATRVELPGAVDPVDTCGTGGAPLRRVAACNVSTMAGFVVAGAGAPDAVLNCDRLDELREDAVPERALAAERAAEAVRETWRSFEFNVQPSLALEALFVRVRRELAGPAVAV